MMNFTRHIAIGITLTAALALSACSSDSGDEATTDASSTGVTSEAYDLAIVTGTKGSPFYEAMVCGAQAASDEYGTTLTASAPDTWGAAEQLPVLDSVAAQNPDALLVVPTDTEALTERLKIFVDGGAPIVELDQRISDDSLSVARIASSDEEGGKAAALAMADLIGDSGKVMVISSPPGTDQQYVRVEAFKAEMEANHPNIEVVGEEYALNDVTLSASHVTAQLAATPDLAGVFVANDVNAVGVVTGLDEAGKTGDVKVVAYDAAQTEVDALKAGSIQALIAQDPYGEGYQGVEQAIAALKGEETAGEINIPLTTLTAEDSAGLDEYLDRNGGC